jgi:hypothetical protein
MSGSVESPAAEQSPWTRRTSRASNWSAGALGSMTWTPMDILAIQRDSAREMKEPAKPMTAHMTSRAW